MRAWPSVWLLAIVVGILIGLILNLVFWLAPDIRRPKSEGGQVITIARVATSPMSSLILKRAPIGRNLEDYDVLCDGVVVGRSFLSPSAPPDRSWMWASGNPHGTSPVA